MSRRRQPVIVVPVSGEVLVLDEDRLFEMRDVLPDNALRRRGMLFGAQVWTLIASIGTKQEVKPCSSTKAVRSERR